MSKKNILQPGYNIQIKQDWFTQIYLPNNMKHISRCILSDGEVSKQNIQSDYSAPVTLVFVLNGFIYHTAIKV